jgi:hypothetical protein
MCNQCEEMNGNCWWTDRPTDSSKAICPLFFEGGHKYQPFCTYHLKVIAKVKVFNKEVKNQGHIVKKFNTYGEVLSQGTFM